MNELEQRWFDATVPAPELEAPERPAPDLRQLKMGLACMLAAVLVLALPALRAAPQPAHPPAPAEVVRAPPQLPAADVARKAMKPSPAKKPAKRTAGKLVARK